MLMPGRQTIIRYLVQTYPQVPDSWLPTAALARASVERVLEWVTMLQQCTVELLILIGGIDVKTSRKVLDRTDVRY